MKNLFKKFFGDSKGKSEEAIRQSTVDFAPFEEALRNLKHQALKEQAIETATALTRGQVVINPDQESKFQGQALAVYLKASKGEKVHIISLNEAVAKRRIDELQGVFHALNLTTGLLFHGQSNEERREAYKKDVVFGTAGAFINDYLKDQKVLDINERRQPTRSFCIVEKGDLILLDQGTRPVGVFGKDEKIIDSITLRSYFSNYGNLSALVDFDGGDQPEFSELYGMETLKFQEEKGLQKSKETPPVRVYKTLEEKRKAILMELKNRAGSTEPLLVSLRNDEKAELLMEHLQEAGILYTSLLLKDRKDEGEFVAEAIENQKMMLVVNPVSRGIEEFLPKSIHIISTERYMLKRNDLHLQRMAFNSGEKSTMEFILSLGDDLLDVFSEEELEQFKDSIVVEIDQPIENEKVIEMMEYVQKRMKEKNASLRAYVQNFESVIQRQREVLYSEREKVLTEEDIKEHILNLMENAIDEEIEKHTANSVFPEEWDLEGLAFALSNSFLPKDQLVFQDVENLTKKDLKAHLIQKASKAYLDRKKNLGKESFDLMQRVLLLKIIDRKWAEHLESMEELRQDMNLRAMGRQDPIRAFQVEGFELFENMTKTIPKDLMKGLFALEEEEK